MDHEWVVGWMHELLCTGCVGVLASYQQKSANCFTTLSDIRPVTVVNDQVHYVAAVALT